MIYRTLLPSLVALAIWLAVTPLARAQETEPAPANPDSAQTDQSEEDWRRSQRRDSDEPFDPISNPSNQGWGVTLPPMRNIDRLPESSQRHLNRERAKVLAQMDMSNPGAVNAAYEPSDAAKSDAGLRADEEAAWATMMAELQRAGQGGSGDASAAGDGEAGSGSGAGTGDGAGTGGMGSGGGQGGSTATGQGLGGGANQSAADLLRQMQGTLPGSGAVSRPLPAGQPVPGAAAPGVGGQQPGDMTGTSSASGEPAGPAGADGGAGETGSAGQSGETLSQEGGSGVKGQGEADGGEASAQAASEAAGEAAGDAGEADASSEASDAASQETATQPAAPEAQAEASEAAASQTPPAPSAPPARSTEAAAASASSAQGRSNARWIELIEKTLGEAPGQPVAVNTRSNEVLIEPGSPQAARVQELRERLRQRSN